LGRTIQSHQVFKIHLRFFTVASVWRAFILFLPEPLAVLIAAIILASVINFRPAHLESGSLERLFCP
jgi:uncharacterized membrane protein